MTPSRLIVGLMVAAWVAVDALLLTERLLDTRRIVEWLGSPALIGILATQVALATLWLAFGRTFFPVRLLFLVAVVVAVARYAATDWTESFSELVALLLGEAALIGGVLFGASWIGARLRNDEDAELAPETERPWQFSLADILTLTLAVGILTASLRAFRLDYGLIGQYPSVAVGIVIWVAGINVSILAFALTFRWAASLPSFGLALGLALIACCWERSPNFSLVWTGAIAAFAGAVLGQAGFYLSWGTPTPGEKTDEAEPLEVSPAAEKPELAPPALRLNSEPAAANSSDA